MRKNLNTCNFPNFLPAPQILFLALFSLHYQYLGGFGGAFKSNERRKYIDGQSTPGDQNNLFVLLNEILLNVFLCMVGLKMQKFDITSERQLLHISLKVEVWMI